MARSGHVKKIHALNMLFYIIYILHHGLKPWSHNLFKVHVESALEDALQEACYKYFPSSFTNQDLFICIFFHDSQAVEPALEDTQQEACCTHFPSSSTNQDLASYVFHDSQAMEPAFDDALEKACCKNFFGTSTIQYLANFVFHDSQAEEAENGTSPGEETKAG